ncbi:cobyric acid synthase [Candidatus Auribacterota bacterium]
MSKTKTVQICGTGSGVGKSIITAGLCRILFQDGYRVAPFKAQNMALNSFVTKEGGEIGRAQAVQALAAKIAPSIDMNPILIKPSSDTGAQIILKGKPIGHMSAIDYVSYKKQAEKEVMAAFNRLKEKFERIVIEGAGSPAEVNLRSHDIVNMKMAKRAKAPVILVGDIDKGGVFAWLIGTLDLLTKSERKLVKGFIINKFRGDFSLLKGGLRFLEQKTGIPVLGVLPYFRNIDIPEEDSVFLSKIEKKIPRKNRKLINIKVIYLPHISNFTDFDALEKEPDVDLTYIQHPKELKNSDLIIIPGSKNTISDLTVLNKTGFSKKILASLKKEKTYIVGICGGFQMLGEKISDLKQIESKEKSIGGLNLLPIETTIKGEKTLAQTEAIHLDTGFKIKGYEIHHGETSSVNSLKPLFKITKKNKKKTDQLDGVSSLDQKIWGTYLHGLFDNHQFRRYFLNQIRKSKGWAPLAHSTSFDVDQEIDKLADLLREHLNLKLFYKILNKND